ncbi:MAG: SHOCT domain-containing protein [Verrucomicrobia bacterium]|jgi:hypothetical protein|nr:SHOCT domain-containing protein [Verrucomicrobiota bacterium]
MSEPYLIVCAVFAVVGALVGKSKNRVAAGAFLSFLLGPIGWALIHFGPDYSKKNKQETNTNGNQTVTSQLLDLKTLLDKGVITQQEFETKKQKLMSQF